MRKWMLALAVLGACGDDGGNTPDAPSVLRYPISFDVLGDEPLLIAVGDDDGEWNVLTATADGSYPGVSVTSSHIIAMVCGGDGTFYTYMVLRTRFDEAPFLFCSNNDGQPTQRFPITGQMQQPGRISMGSTDAGTTSPWTFDLSVSAGAHDLAAFGTTQAAVRRDIAVTAAATLPTIDLAAEGAFYATFPVILANGETDETISTRLNLFTGNDVAIQEWSGSTLYELPANLLVANDFQSGSLEATTATTRRTAPIDDSQLTQTITLMPRLSGITFTPDGATWPSLPPTTTSIRVFSASATNYQSIEATGQYLAGAFEVAAQPRIPRYEHAWLVTNPIATTFTAYDDDGQSTAVTMLAPTTAAASRGPVDDALRVRGAAARMKESLTNR